VFSIDRDLDLLRAAERCFEELRLRNIVCRFGDGTKGWPEQAPYNWVIVTAAAPVLPIPLIDRLAPGGVLITPVGEDYRGQRLVRVRRDDSRVSIEDLGVVRSVPLVVGLPRRTVVDHGLT
jgi:protein-L-isoaspartate(D-aspartate) O-methyltransferase